MTIQQLPMWITIYGLAAIVAAVVAYVVAASKHRDASHWATVSFLLPPLAILTFFLSTTPAEHRQAHAVEKRLRKYFDPDY